MTARMVAAKDLQPGDYSVYFRDTVANSQVVPTGVYVQFTNDGFGVVLRADREVLVR